MKKPHDFKTILPEITAAFLIFLFIYASSSKLLNYQKFRVELGQSPLLTAFAGWIAWIIPSIEILISLLLAIHAFRLIALYASFSLMALFTAYIIAITRFSDYVPCSCGGVLQKMTWDTHLIFNIAVILLTMSAIVLYNKPIGNHHMVASS